MVKLDKLKAKMNENIFLRKEKTLEMIFLVNKSLLTIKRSRPTGRPSLNFVIQIIA